MGDRLGAIRQPDSASSAPRQQGACHPEEVDKTKEGKERQAGDGLGLS